MNVDQNERGRVDIGGNELLVDSTIDDPPKVRQGSPVTGGAFGCISGDRIVVNETGSVVHRKEKVLLILKPDGQPGEGGCYDFFAQRPGTEDDANMVRVARLTTTAFELFVPLVQHSGVPTPDPQPVPPEPAPAPAPQPPSPGGLPNIAPGDFGGIVRHYGFASDDEQPYSEGRLTWTEVLLRMERRK